MKKGYADFDYCWIDPNEKQLWDNKYRNFAHLQANPVRMTGHQPSDWTCDCCHGHLTQKCDQGKFIVTQGATIVLKYDSASVETVHFRCFQGNHLCRFSQRHLKQIVVMIYAAACLSALRNTKRVRLTWLFGYLLMCLSFFVADTVYSTSPFRTAPWHSGGSHLLGRFSFCYLARWRIIRSLATDTSERAELPFSLLGETSVVKIRWTSPWISGKIFQVQFIPVTPIHTKSLVRYSNETRRYGCRTIEWTEWNQKHAYNRGFDHKRDAVAAVLTCSGLGRSHATPPSQKLLRIFLPRHMSHLSVFLLH